MDKLPCSISRQEIYRSEFSSTQNLTSHTNLVAITGPDHRPTSLFQIIIQENSSTTPIRSLHSYYPIDNFRFDSSFALRFPSINFG